MMDYSPGTIVWRLQHRRLHNRAVSELWRAKAAFRAAPMNHAALPFGLSQIRWSALQRNTEAPKPTRTAACAHP